MRVVIVGGVAGGASAAARIRRLSEDAEIVLCERGEQPSFANCGMPYYIGGQILERDRLIVSSTFQLRTRYRIDVRARTEVVSIDRGAKSVRLRELDTGHEVELTYDKLILSPGASPLRPPIPGIEAEGIFTLRDLADADRLHAAATGKHASAVIVGAGFIGVELAENLVHRGLTVTLVELAGQVLPPWDYEMTTPLAQHLRERGVTVLLGQSAEAFSRAPQGVRVQLSAGQSVDAGFVVLCIGVRPENRLAQEAGLAVGPRGGIRTNQHMQTDDPDIYAVGDAVEVVEFVSGQPTQIPLAGPANRQGRIAADHLLGRDSAYRGTPGTSVVGVFDMTAALTGLSEKLLQRLNLPYEKVYVHAGDHAGYYPGATPITLKLLFDPNDGRLLGAQAVGRSGVDKRIDVLAMALQARMSVYDLEEAELCYAPQYGSAKDPVNMAGFVASNMLRGDQPIVHSDGLDQAQADGALLLDVRSEAEYRADHIPGAESIPLDQLRERIGELPPDRRIVAYCQVGQRGYMATRILQHNGRDVANLSGGFVVWKLFRP
jgi:NADPH-dependent 2,4-dienoyl-CoA reductase/sulfur reductase-like enzyme/rhodanese-related sulfurtransferase